MKKRLCIIISCLIISLFTASCNKQEHICEYSYTDYNESFHYAVCKEDNTHIFKQEHNFEFSTTLKQASSSSYGQDQYKCKDCGRTIIKNTNPTVELNYDKEIVDDRYLKERISDASAIYYKSDSNGNFGNDNYIFEHTLIPSEYSEVSYLESDGTQYIDTGVIGKTGLSSEIKCYFYNRIHCQSVLCSRIDDGDTRCYMLHLDNGRIYAGLGSLPSDIQVSSVNDEEVTYKTVLSSQKTELYCNNTLVYEGEGKQYNTNKNLYLFGNNYDNDHQLFILRVYFCKIWDNDSLIRNFIPVIRNSDSLPGMYDLVDNKFYETKKEYSNFGIGNEINDNSLPNEYQEVEYIESNGTQTINTNLSIGDSSSTYLTLTNNYLKRLESQQMFGYYSNPGFGFGLYEERIFPDLLTINFNVKRTFEIFTDYNTYTLKINGINITTTSNYQYKDCTLPFTLFSSIYDYGFRHMSCYSYERLYKCSIYQDNILKRDLVPCYRKIDNIAGLYDLVNNVFYSNSHCSSFNYGEIVLHKYELTNTIKEPKLGEKGQDEYTCKICGNKYYVDTLPLAYRTSFIKDEGIKEIRILKSTNINDYEVNNIAYSINPKTYNYSSNNGEVWFIPVLKDGYQIDEITSSSNNTVVYNNNYYIISNYTDNSTITISTKKV